MGFAITNTGFLSMVSDYFPEKQMGLVGGINSFTTLFSAGFGIALLGYLHPIVSPLVQHTHIRTAWTYCTLLHFICFMHIECNCACYSIS